jgi:anti-anti-sigma factor
VNLAGLDFHPHDERTLVATMSGELDFSNAEAIRTALATAVSNQSLALVLDLTAVDYLDSAGIELLYRLRQDLRSRGQALHVVIPPDSASNAALRLAGVEHNLDVLPTLAAALAASAPPGADAGTVETG